VGQVIPHLRLPKGPGMLGAVVLYVPDNPAEIRLLRERCILFGDRPTGRDQRKETNNLTTNRPWRERESGRVVWFDVHSVKLYRVDTLTPVGITLL